MPPAHAVVDAVGDAVGDVVGATNRAGQQASRRPKSCGPVKGVPALAAEGTPGRLQTE